jgi:uncharacterized protein (TIGR01244 family)
MWPFSSAKPDTVKYRTIDSDFAVAGQVLPGQLEAVAAAGFKTVVCARPDNEEPGQPSFRQISAEAGRLGLEAVYIPISGGISDSSVRAMKTALKDLPTPMYGYCRSGARAGALYGAARRS